MSKLVFYRQLRMDGGIRTAIEVDGETVYGIFEEGETDHNPRLRWFVDLRCVGSKLPRSGRGARKWLLEHGAAIAAGFAQSAREIRAGFDPDPDIYSSSWQGFAGLPPGVEMTLVLCAARREDAIAMPAVLRDLSDRWDRIIRALKLPVQEVQR